MIYEITNIVKTKTKVYLSLKNDRKLSICKLSLPINKYTKQLKLGQKINVNNVWKALSDYNFIDNPLLSR